MIGFGFTRVVTLKRLDHKYSFVLREYVLVVLSLNEIVFVITHLLILRVGFVGDQYHQFHLLYSKFIKASIIAMISWFASLTRLGHLD